MMLLELAGGQPSCLLSVAKRKEIMQAVPLTVAARAAVKRNMFLELAGSQPSCVLSAAKSKEIMEAVAAAGAAVARRKEMQVAAAAAAARAVVKRNTFLELAGSQPSCILSAAKTLK